MKIATPKRISAFRRPKPLRHKLQSKPCTSSSSNFSSLNDGLAICLFGFTNNMYDSEYEEEVRKRAIMAEVLPDEVMWAAWAKNEAPLRKGRGWYPALDRHFLELLVISEIHCLANPLNGPSTQPGQAERVHRHASRVRRVACERIGAERLHAYCDRVKEAFEAYMHGGWVGEVRGYEQDPASESASSDNDSDDDEEEEEADRGRSLSKGDGSVIRTRSPDRDLNSPKKDNFDPFADENAEGDDPEAMALDEADLRKIDLVALRDESIPEIEDESMDVEITLGAETKQTSGSETSTGKAFEEPTTTVPSVISNAAQDTAQGEAASLRESEVRALAAIKA